MKRLLIIGASGSGRSTQAQRVAQQLEIVSVSSSKVIEECIIQNVHVSEEIRGYIDRGELVPDGLIIDVMRARISATDAQLGWVLEGYPCTPFQAEELDFLLEEFGTPIDRVFYLQLSENLLRERALRRGDSPELIERRLENFFEQEMTLVDYYGHKQLLSTIDASLAMEEVTAAMISNLP